MFKTTDGKTMNGSNSSFGIGKQKVLLRASDKEGFCFVILIQIFGGQNFPRMLEIFLLKIIVNYPLIDFVSFLIRSLISPKKKKKKDNKMCR